MVELLAAFAGAVLGALFGGFAVAGVFIRFNRQQATHRIETGKEAIALMERAIADAAAGASRAPQASQRRRVDRANVMSLQSTRRS